MSDTNQKFKLKNPTEYHLLRQQQLYQETDSAAVALLEEQHLDFSDCFTTPQQQQQFLSPTFTSPPLQDFDDLDSLSTGLPSSSALVGNMMIEPSHFQQQYIFPGSLQHEVGMGESLSEYSSSFDMFSNSQRSTSYFHQNDPHLSTSFGEYQQQQPFSAPAQTGYEFLVGHMGSIALQQQTPSATFTQSLAATGSRSLEEYESLQLNHQLLAEKKRRRRESHNAVERRRRENINERIQELGTMLPATMLDELITTNANGSSNKPNKGAILRKSVDHIRILQQEVTSHRQRIFELERQLAELS